MTAPGFDQYGFNVPARGPRPQVKTGAGLLMAGAVLHIVAVFLPWYEGAGITLRGMDDYITDKGESLPAPGKVWIVVGAILLGLGVASYFFGRQLAVAIIAVIVAAGGVFTSLLGVGAAKATRDRLGDGDAALGAYIGIVSILVALAGSIQILAKRRR